MTPAVVRHAHICTLQNLDDRMASWHEKKYGSPAPTNKPRTFAKLIEELGEFSEAWNNFHSGMSGQDHVARRAQVLEELSDIILLCFNLSRAVGGGLPQAILDKLQTIHDRLYADARMGRKEPPPPAIRYEATYREDALSPSWVSPAVAGVQVVEGSP